MARYLKLILAAATIVTSFATATAAQTPTGTFVLVSDIHFDPFDPDGIARTLATIDPGTWMARFAALPPGPASQYGKDTNHVLLSSALAAIAKTAAECRLRHRPRRPPLPRIRGRHRQGARRAARLGGAAGLLQAHHHLRRRGARRGARRQARHPRARQQRFRLRRLRDRAGRRLPRRDPRDGAESGRRRPRRRRLRCDLCRRRLLRRPPPDGGQYAHPRRQ